MIIGICGKSGSGKTTLAKSIIKEYKNGIHLEIDKVGHNALINDDVKIKLIERFGPVILTNDNIDRKKLGKIVFSSKLDMKCLSDITWEYMQKEIDEFLNNNKDKIIILDYLLLPKTKYFEMCDIKILLDIPYEVRKERALKRDNITEEAFNLRDGASIDYNLSDFDYVINKVDEFKIEGLVKLL